MRFIPVSFYYLKAGLLDKPVTSAHPELTPLTYIKYLCMDKMNCPLPKTILLSTGKAYINAMRYFLFFFH